MENSHWQLSLQLHSPGNKRHWPRKPSSWLGPSLCTVPWLLPPWSAVETHPWCQHTFPLEQSRNNWNYIVQVSIYNFLKYSYVFSVVLLIPLPPNPKSTTIPSPPPYYEILHQDTWQRSYRRNCHLSKSRDRASQA